MIIILLARPKQFQLSIAALYPWFQLEEPGGCQRSCGVYLALYGGAEVRGAN
jgi:hypothetical protein